MKKLIIFSLFILISSWSFSQSETRDVDDFNKLDVSAGINAILVNSDETKIHVKMKKGELSDLVSSVRNGKLKLSWKQSNAWMNSRSVEVTVYFNQLNEVEASSGSNVSSEECINTQEMELDCSSGAMIKLEIESQELLVDVSSGAAVRVKGFTKNQEVDVSSGASYKGSDLISENTKAEASSGAGARVYATEFLKARASSGGSIKYGGNPKETDITKDKWSGGSIREY